MTILKKATANIYITQSLGMLGYLVFSNNVMLLYLLALGIEESVVVMLISLNNFGQSFFLVPFAFLNERYGKKRLGNIGIAFSVLGFSLLCLTPYANERSYTLLVAIGILIQSMGLSLYASGWFALLSPIVPADKRGRFFGNMRLIFTLVNFGLTIIISMALGDDSSIFIFQIFFAIITFALFLRAYFYNKIPELETQRSQPKIKAAFGTIIHSPGVASYCSYVFLMSLFSGAILSMFGLIEKQELDLGDSLVTTLSNLTILGSIAGFIAGGYVIDKWGSRIIFLICHFLYAISMAVFVFRLTDSSQVIIQLGIAHLIHGAVVAALGIGITTEMLAIVPNQYKSISTATIVTMWAGGAGMSQLISGSVIDLNLLEDYWQLGGFQFSQFDTIILANAMMILLTTITLGLVPSVISPRHKTIED